MIYENCLYSLFSQNKLKNDDFTFKIKKSDLVKNLKQISQKQQLIQ